MAYGLWWFSKPSWHLSLPFPIMFSPHVLLCGAVLSRDKWWNWLYLCSPGTLLEAPSWPSWLSNHIPVYPLTHFIILQKTHHVGHTIIHVCVCLLCQSINSSKVLIPILVAQTVKNLPSMQEMQVQSLGQEDPVEEGTAIHSSILFWRIPRTEEPGGLQSIGSQRVRHNWATDTFTFYFSLNTQSRALERKRHLINICRINERCI